MIGPDATIRPAYLMAGTPPGARPRRTGGSAAPRETLRRRIAIVEDELMVAWSLESTLEELGHRVEGIYAGGEAALAAWAGSPPELVLMDINLGGGIDGVETARRLRAAHAVPVIFISAYADKATESRIAEAVPGARLLRKPVEAETLAEAIRWAGALPH